MAEVVAAYADPGKEGVKQVQSSGLHIAGERFVVIKADERSVYGKKVGSYSSRNGTWRRPPGGRLGGARGHVLTLLCDARDAKVW